MPCYNRKEETLLSSGSRQDLLVTFLFHLCPGLLVPNLLSPFCQSLIPPSWASPPASNSIHMILSSSPTELGKAMPCEFHIPESLHPQVACLPIRPPSVSPHHLIQGTTLSCPGDDDSPGLLVPTLGTRESYSCRVKLRFMCSLLQPSVILFPHKTQTPHGGE